VQRYPYPLLDLAPQLLPIHHYSLSPHHRLLPMLQYGSSQSRLLTIPSLEDTVDRLGLMLPSVVCHAQTEIQLYAQQPTAVTRMSPALQRPPLSLFQPLLQPQSQKLRLLFRPLLQPRLPHRLLAPAEEATQETAVVLLLTCAAPNGATVAVGTLGVIVVNSG
jgi:hypothetical protein